MIHPASHMSASESSSPMTPNLPRLDDAGALKQVRSGGSEAAPSISRVADLVLSSPSQATTDSLPSRNQPAEDSQPDVAARSSHLHVVVRSSKPSLAGSSNCRTDRTSSPVPYIAYEFSKAPVRCATRLVPYSSYQTFIDRNPWHNEEDTNLTIALRGTSRIPCFLLQHLLAGMLSSGFQWLYRSEDQWISARAEVEQLIQESKTSSQLRKDSLASFVARGLIEESTILEGSRFSMMAKSIWEKQFTRPDKGTRNMQTVTPKDFTTDDWHGEAFCYEFQSKAAGKQQAMMGPVIEPYRPDIEAENIMNQRVQSFEVQVQIVRDTLDASDTETLDYADPPPEDGLGLNASRKTVYEIVMALRRIFHARQMQAFEVDANGLLAILKIAHAMVDYDIAHPPPSKSIMELFDDPVYQELTRALRILRNRRIYNQERKNIAELADQQIWARIRTRGGLSMYGPAYHEYLQFLFHKVPEGTRFWNFLRSEGF